MKGLKIVETLVVKFIKQADSRDQLDKDAEVGNLDMFGEIKFKTKKKHFSIVKL